MHHTHIKQNNNMKYEYEILKVGDADIIIIRQYINNESFLILIDAGNANNSSTIKNHLKQYYKTTYIDLAICTHPDSDHKDGFFDLLQDPEMTFAEFWLTDPAEYIDENDIARYRNHDNAVRAVRKIWNKSTDDRLNLIDLACSKCSIVRSVIDGVKHSILPISIVGPTSMYYQEVVKNMVQQYGINTYDDSSKELYDDTFRIDDKEIQSVIDTVEDESPYNASSLIVLYRPGDGKQFLFTGDANTTSLAIMIEKYRWIRNIDLLKVPHHGSRRNLNTKIITELAPKKSYISAAGNAKHPNGRLVYWLAKHGPVYSTHTANGYIHAKSAEMEAREGVSTLAPLKAKTII